jgi:hypothetical protein
MLELTVELQDYLRSATYLPTELRLIIDELLGPKSASTVRLNLDEQTLERFRSVFTERLAQAGFDIEYRLSAEGVRLEELIDRFSTSTR